LLFVLPFCLCLPRAVWNQQFQFMVVNENNIHIVIKDSDVGSDDLIGQGSITLANVRQRGSSNEKVMLTTKSGKQRGMVSVSLTFAASGPPAVGHGGPSAPPVPYPGRRCDRSSCVLALCAR
jgi:hypothetical protein